MSIGTSLRGAGGLLLLGGSLSTAAVTLGLRAAHVATDITGPAARVEDWVELIVTGSVALAAAWVAFGSLLGLAVVVASTAGARWRAGEAAVRVLAPGVVHRLVRAAIGAGVGAGLVLAPTTAMAAPANDPATVTATTSRATLAIDLGWRPTTATPPAADAPAPPAETPAPPTEATLTVAVPTDGGATTAPTARRTSPSTDGTVVVLRGDTLWDIAAQWLGGDPTDAQVLAATVSWHEANRAVIGADPDLLLPGQILTPPDASA